MTQNNTLLKNDLKNDFDEFEELLNNDKSSVGIYITMIIATAFLIMALLSLFYTDLLLF